jgi:hypothetical protein
MGRLIEGYQDATPLLGDPVALRAEAEREGVLFFKGLLPRETVLALRRQVLEIIAGLGWLRPGSDPQSGLVDRDVLDKLTREQVESFHEGIPLEAYHAIQRLEDFHALAHHPRLIALYQALFDAPVLPHPRNIARVVLVNPFSAPTPPHQDYHHIQGTADVWTCWFTLGDCPRSMGGLSVAPRSHHDGLYTVHAAPGAGGIAINRDEDALDWIVDDFEAGDVLTVHSHTVHKALPHRNKDFVRVSCDFRYQSAEEPIHEASLRPHCGIFEWEELYAGWKRQDLQYYWKKHKLELAEWNADLHKPAY